MSRNLEALQAVERDLHDLDAVQSLQCFLLGWLAEATPEAMWNAGIAAWRESRA